MKLVLINSTGPMGSSVVAAILEKFGYLNLPARDLGLPKYLMSGDKNDLEQFKDNFHALFDNLTKELLVGGVNVLDRDSSKPRPILDKVKANNALNDIKKLDIENLSNLYQELWDALARAIIYKKNRYIPRQHVELVTNFHHFNVQKLIDAYRREFEKVTFIFMHRAFVPWIESLASQRFINPKKRFHFVFRWEYQRYIEYEEAIKNCSGIHIDFESLFDPNTRLQIEKIAKKLGIPMPGINWKNEQFDLYGNLKNYNAAFSLADYEGKYFSKLTRSVMQYFFEKRKITRVHDVVIYGLYLIDLCRFLIRKKLSSISMILTI